MSLKSLSSTTSIRQLLISTALMLCIPCSASADPIGDYQGWLFESGLISYGNFTEEQCFGELDLPIAADLNWTLDLPDEVCWGRTTSSTGRTPFNFPPFAVDNFEADQSTRPLVSAGGNLWEMYGEEFDDGIGQGEERFLAFLASPSTENFLLGATYNGENDQFGVEYFRSIAPLVKSTPAVKAARVAADLEGTVWRQTIYSHSFSDSNVNAEVASTMFSSLNLQAGGVCSYSISSAIPEFVDNGDVFLGFQFDDGAEFDDRFVRGSVDQRALSNCSWSLDADDYLSITRTTTRALDPNNPTVSTFRFVVSDDNRHFVPAPAPVADDSTRALVAGYRAASQLANNAIDNTYFFYLSLSEFGADGAGAAAAGFGPRGWQEFDALGRGQVTFDSSTIGTTPAGETGTWFACSMDMVISQNEHDLTGSTSNSSVALNDLSVIVSDIVFAECDYQLATDGAISLYVLVVDGEDGGFEGILRGYVNDNAEIVSMIFGDFAGDSQNINKDVATLMHLIGMQYTGDPTADADGDGLTNYEEFKLPLAPVVPDPRCSAAPLPVICAMSDNNGDGQPDVAAAIPGSVDVYVRDGVTDAAINDIAFGSDPGIAVEMINDLDGNGAPEVAVLSLRPSGQVVVTVRDSLTDAVINTIFYGAAYSPLDMAILPDSDGNGAPEFVVLGVDSGGGIRAQARDALTDAATSTTFYGANATAIDVQVIPDMNGNDAPEIAMHARVNASSQGRVQFRDSLTGALIRQVFFGTVYAPQQIAVIDDVTGDGIPELAQLARRDDTGAVRIQVKNPVDGATVSNAFTGDTDRPVDIVGTGGMVGMLVEDAGGVAKVIKRNASTGAFVGNVFMGAIGVPEALVVMDDLDGSGDPEFAALGDNAGQRVIQIKDTISGAQINNISVP